MKRYRVRLVPDSERVVIVTADTREQAEARAERGEWEVEGRVVTRWRAVEVEPEAEGESGV